MHETEAPRERKPLPGMMLHQDAGATPGSKAGRRSPHPTDQSGDHAG